ncbi:MAG TPA: hypothetical protein VMW58_10355 [Anaerolineae bacterium]|nr:hypothetical protein [Anaerolineae bacterium]
MPSISCLFWSSVVLLIVLFLGLLLSFVAVAIREVLLGARSRNWRRGMRGVALLAAVLLAAVLLCGAPLNSIRKCIEVPYSNPPSTLQDADFVGTWEARYGESIDRLTFKADGTFRQLYDDGYDEDYVYETPWNKWSLERFPDGRLRICLEGARFYEEGIRVAEQGVGLERWVFYDPVSNESVDMRAKVVLNVRIDRSGELLLYHMWSSADEGFAIVGCERNMFRHVETP